MAAAIIVQVRMASTDYRGRIMKEVLKENPTRISAGKIIAVCKQADQVIVAYHGSW